MPMASGGAAPAIAPTIPSANYPQVRISTTTLGVAGSITLSAIPASYTHLLILALLRGDNASASIGCNIQCNGDVGANYDSETMEGLQTLAVTAQQNLAVTSAPIGGIPASTAQAAEYGMLQIWVPFYTNTVARKLILGSSGFVDTTGSFSRSGRNTGHWRNTAAITSLTLLASAGNLVAGSTVTLYGVF